LKLKRALLSWLFFALPVLGQSSTINGPVQVTGPVVVNPASGGGSGGSLTLGESLQNTSDGNSNLPLANLFTTPSGSSGFTVNSVQIFQNDSGSHTLDAGIYSTTGSPPVPNSRLCHTSGSVSGSGVKTVTLSGCPTLSATTVYAIGMIDNGSGTNQGKAEIGAVGVTCPAAPQSQPLTVFSTTQGSTVLPASWGGSTSVANACFLMQVNLTCVGACGVIPSNLTLVDMEGLTNGTQATSATLQHFSGCGGNITGIFNLNSGGSYSGYTGATAAQLPFVHSQTLCGATSTGSGSLGYDFATNTPAGGPFSNTTMKFLSPGNVASVLFPVTWTFTNDGAHAYSNVAIIGSETVNMQLTSGGMRMETSTGSTSSITVTDGNTYYVCLVFDGTSGHSHSMTVFDNTGASLGTVTRANSGVQAPTTLVIGITGGEAEVSSQHLRWDNLLLDPTGAFACTP